MTQATDFMGLKQCQAGCNRAQLKIGDEKGSGTLPAPVKGQIGEVSFVLYRARGWVWA